MSFAHPDTPRQRPLTNRESAALAREVLDRARQALRQAQATAGHDQPGQQPRTALFSRLRRAVRAVRRAAAAAIAAPGFEPCLIAVVLALSATGALWQFRP